MIQERIEVLYKKIALRTFFVKQFMPLKVKINEVKIIVYRQSSKILV